jgi:Flavin containing amine oxidoreductase
MSGHTIPALDYAIVGGGVSGIYSGWRLLRDAASGGTKPGIGLFESSDRLGGRLLSVVPPGIPEARVELGGMRYVDPAHAWVSSLVGHLGLKTEILPADEPQNICYIRGRMLRMFELTDASKVPYQLAPAVSTKQALSNLTAYSMMPELADTIEAVVGIRINSWNELSTKLSDADWQTLATKGSVDGTPLSDIPLRFVMARALGHEALALAQDSVGYSSILHTWNAADGFPWNVGDYGPLVTYRHVTDGYDKLPQILAQQFVDAGGMIHLNASLRSFTSDDPGGPITLTLTEDGTTRIVLTRRLILAMPRRSLELLDPVGPVLGPGNAEVHDLVRSVVPIPLFKLAICYSRPWWEEIQPVNPGTGLMAKIRSGRSTTDLPIRQCYYWKVDPATRHAVVLIYDDGWDLEYWADLRDSDAPSHPDDPDLANDDSTSSLWSRHKAPRRMVLEAHRQLLEMHGITDPSVVPLPYSASYRDWGEDPYGGGANFWPVGVRSYEVSKRIVQPKPPYPVYICGDAYSHAQAWVEGAIETAEDMLQRHLGLTAPVWKTSGAASKEKRR